MARHIAERFTAPGPKRILALDGGGTRGIISLAFLERMEKMLAERFESHPRFAEKQFVLSDYFDLIGGTSVGALVAAQLARGMSAAHFVCKTLPKVATEMALAVLGYNFTRVLKIMGVERLIATLRA
jgi:surfactin synthase thioesterase subunit